MNELYGGIDPREIPTYSIGDAAKYLRIPAATIRSWTVGVRYRKALATDNQQPLEGKRPFKPVISIRERKPWLLSFTNLIEIHVLRAIRKNHKVQLDKVRLALDFLDEKLRVAHPLAREEFRTDGVDLFIERYGTLINASKSGQIELKDSLNSHLKRIELDDSGLAIKLYPFTRSDEENNPQLVVIDPRIAFGRLVIAGTGIPTSLIAERYRAGDSIEDLSYDYDCALSSIEEAIRCEMPVAA